MGLRATAPKRCRRFSNARANRASEPRESIGATILGQAALASPFGAAGTIAVILVWVYYSTQIVLFGAEFTRANSSTQAHEPQPMAGAVRVATPAS